MYCTHIHTYIHTVLYCTVRYCTWINLKLQYVSTTFELRHVNDPHRESKNVLSHVQVRFFGGNILCLFRYRVQYVFFLFNIYIYYCYRYIKRKIYLKSYEIYIILQVCESIYINWFVKIYIRDRLHVHLLILYIFIVWIQNQRDSVAWPYMNTHTHTHTHTDHLIMYTC